MRNSYVIFMSDPHLSDRAGINLKEPEADLRKYKFKPRVAVCNLVFTKDGSVLLMQRRKKDALENVWGPVGGKLEYLEAAHQAALRELREETSLDLCSPCFIGFTENIGQYPHYVVLWFAYLLDAPCAIRFESSENGEYGWFKQADLPTPVEESTKKMIAAGWGVITSKHSSQ